MAADAGVADADDDDGSDSVDVDEWSSSEALTARRRDRPPPARPPAAVSVASDNVLRGVRWRPKTALWPPGAVSSRQLDAFI